MGFNRFSQYPPGIYHVDLGADRDVCTSLGRNHDDPLSVNWVQLSNHHASRNMDVRLTDGSRNTIAHFYVQAEDNVQLGGFETNGFYMVMKSNSKQMKGTVAFW